MKSLIQKAGCSKTIPVLYLSGEIDENSFSDDKANVFAEYLDYNTCVILLKQIFYERAKLHVENQEEKNKFDSPYNPIIDGYTIASILDLNNEDSKNNYHMRQVIFSEMVWRKMYELKIPCNDRILNAYLRSHRSSYQLQSLFTLARRIYKIDLKDFDTNSIIKDVKCKSKSKYWNSQRSSNEFLNAVLRVGELRYALPLAKLFLQHFESKIFERSNKVNYSKFLQPATMNMCIHFERYWRDYEHDDNPSTKLYGYRNIKEESKLLISIILHGRKLNFMSSSTNKDNLVDLNMLSSVLASLLSRDRWNDAIDILDALNSEVTKTSNAKSILTAKDIARIVEVAVFSSLDGCLPLLTSSAPGVLNNLRKEKGLTVLMTGVADSMKIKAGNIRTTSTIAQIVTFLELYQQVNMPSSTSVPLGPIGVSLLECLFVESIMAGKNDIASRLVLVLSRSRLVIDLEISTLRHRQELNVGPVNVDKDDVSSRYFEFGVSRSLNEVQYIRMLLAQKWAAQLVGTSLNRFSKGFLNAVVTSKLR